MTRPLIETPRLRLEPVTRHHAREMVPVLDSAALYEFMPSDPPTLSELSRQYEFLETGLSPKGDEHWLTWILCRKTDNAHLGFVQATVREPLATIAYVVGAPFWRHGYAKEAVSGMLTSVFSSFEVERARAEMDTRNAASIALMCSLGFRWQKTIEQADVFKGSSSDEHIYELSRAEWVAQKAEPSGVP